MTRPRRATVGTGILVLLGFAVVVLPPVLLPDAPAPPALAPFVASARHQLWVEGTPIVPPYLRFVEARCQAGGTAVALVFEDWRFPYLNRTYAYAIRGSMPTTGDDGWGGGFGVKSLTTDDEFLYQMGPNSKPCE